MAFSSSLTLPGHSASESAWIKLRRKTNVLVAEALRISSPELGGESRDVFAALAKRRDDHFDHCQTVVQVFPEASCGGVRF